MPLCVLALCASSCVNGGERKALVALVRFESELKDAIVYRDTKAFGLLFASSIEHPETIKALSLVFENSGSALLENIRLKGYFYEIIFSDAPYSLSSTLPMRGDYPLSYALHAYNGVYAASIRYGDYINASYPVEFIALYQNGAWELVTINLEGWSG